MTPELSAIRGTNVEGPALDIEPSAISTSSVEGSTLDTRTIRDIDLQRGRFNTWIPNHPRYQPSAWKVQLWTSNRPRYRLSAWKVHPLNPEPSAPKPQTVEGSRRASNRALPQKKKETGVSANLPLLILFRNGLEPLL